MRAVAEIARVSLAIAHWRQRERLVQECADLRVAGAFHLLLNARTALRDANLDLKIAWQSLRPDERRAAIASIIRRREP